MSNPNRCQNCGAPRASHNPKAYTGCSKFRRRTEEQERQSREIQEAFFAVVRAANQERNVTPDVTSAPGATEATR